MSDDFNIGDAIREIASKEDAPRGASPDVEALAKAMDELTMEDIGEAIMGIAFREGLLTPDNPESREDVVSGPPSPTPGVWAPEDTESLLSPTKASLSRIMRWSSSRYNEYRKYEVVQFFLNHLKANDPGVWTFTSGSYAPGGHLGGWCWSLHISEGGRFLVLNEDGPDQRVWRIR